MTSFTDADTDFAPNHNSATDASHNLGKYATWYRTRNSGTYSQWRLIFGEKYIIYLQNNEVGDFPSVHYLGSYEPDANLGGNLGMVCGFNTNQATTISNWFPLVLGSYNNSSTGYTALVRDFSNAPNVMCYATMTSRLATNNNSGSPNLILPGYDTVTGKVHVSKFYLWRPKTKTGYGYLPGLYGLDGRGDGFFSHHEVIRGTGAMSGKMLLTVFFPGWYNPTTADGMIFVALN